MRCTTSAFFVLALCGCLAVLPGCLLDWRPSVPDAAVSAAQSVSNTGVSLRPLWHSRESWSDVAVDDLTRRIFGLRGTGQDIREIAADGSVLRTIVLMQPRVSGPMLTIPQRHRLEIAQQARGEMPSFVTWGRWSDHRVQLFDFEGRHRWTRELRGGVNRIVTADVDGQSGDEIGDAELSSPTGYFDLDGRAIPLVDRSSFKIVPLPAALSDTGCWAIDGPYTGEVTLVSAAGQPITVLRPRAHELLCGRGGSSPHEAVIVTFNDGPLVLEATNLDGSPRWIVRDDEITGDCRMPSDAAISPDGSMLAIVMRGGRVLLYDMRDGRRLADAQVPARWSTLAWGRSPSGSDMILVATGALHALEVVRGG